jgi:hypothetical protein
MKRASPPLPSQQFIPIHVAAQGMFNFDDLPVDESGEWELECQLSDSLRELFHSYGVYCSRLDMIYFGNNVFVTATIAAGEFHAQPTFGANRSKNPVRGLCSKFLRFIRAREQEFG